jgi:hypothetical protein
LVAPAEKVDGSENPPEKNVAGQISAGDKNAVAAGIISGLFSAVVQKVHMHSIIRACAPPEKKVSRPQRSKKLGWGSECDAINMKTCSHLEKAISRFEIYQR